MGTGSKKEATKLREITKVIRENYTHGQFSSIFKGSQLLRLSDCFRLY